MWALIVRMNEYSTATAAVKYLDYLLNPTTERNIYPFQRLNNYPEYCCFCKPNWKKKHAHTHAIHLMSVIISAFNLMNCSLYASFAFGHVTLNGALEFDYFHFTRKIQWNLHHWYRLHQAPVAVTETVIQRFNTNSMDCKLLCSSMYPLKLNLHETNSLWAR